jgi:hypothetical protein
VRRLTRLSGVREQLVGEGLELRRSGVREVRTKVLADARGEDRGHRSVRFSGMGKKGREAIAERKWPNPEVEPEGRGGAVANVDVRSLNMLSSCQHSKNCAAPKAPGADLCTFSARNTGSKHKGWICLQF